MQQHFLQLNIEKTEIILFGNKEGSSLLKSRAIKTTTHTKNPGVILDGDLSFRDCIKAITKSASCHLKHIAKARIFC